MTTPASTRPSTTRALPACLLESIAAAVAILRNDPEAVRLLRLRVADVGTSLFNLTIYYADMRDALRAVAKATP